MGLQVINVGLVPNDGQGDPLRTAYQKCNSNFAEIYSRAQPNPPASSIGAVGDQAGMYAYDSNYFYYCYADYDGVSNIWAEVAQIGNVAAITLARGNSNVSFDAIGGNIVFSVSGTSNVAILRPDALTVNANIVANNYSGATLLLSGQISTTGNITGANLLAQGTLSTTGSVKSDEGAALGGAYTGAFNDAVAIDYVTGNGRISVGASDGLNIFNAGVGNTLIASFDTVGALTLGTSGTANLTAGNVNGGNLNATTGLSVATLSLAGNTISSTDTNITIDPASSGTGGNVIIQGNLSVTGNVTYISSNVVTINDILINVANNAATASAANGGGLGVGPAGAEYATLTYNSSGNTWTVSNGATVSGILSASGNVTGGNLQTGGQVSATGNITGGNISVGSGSSTAGSYSASGNITGGNINTSGQVSASGNVVGQYLKGDGTFITGITVSAGTQIVNGSSNVTAVANANVTVGISGTSNVAVFATTGAYITGVISASGNVRGANINTDGLMTATGNVTGGNILTGGIVSAASHIGSVVSVSGNVTGGNILTAGLISSTGNISSSANISGTYLLGNAYFVTGLSPTQIYNGNSNVTVPVSSGNVAVNVNGSGIIEFTSSGMINNMGNGVGNIGNSTNYFNTVFAKATNAQYADLAENYIADSPYEPGTVVVIGGTAEVTASTTDQDRSVAGVVSTQPAYLMNSSLQGDNVVSVALIGRVPCKVKGPVGKGDLLVSTVNGHAKSEANPQVGTVIGKALESFTGDQGVIEIVVGKL